MALSRIELNLSQSVQRDLLEWVNPVGHFFSFSISRYDMSKFYSHQMSVYDIKSLIFSYISICHKRIVT